jgi:hypothetical protein
LQACGLVSEERLASSAGWPANPQVLVLGWTLLIYFIALLHEQRHIQCLRDREYAKRKSV